MAVKREQAKEYLALMLSQSKAHESDNALVAFLESAKMDGPVLLQRRYAQFPHAGVVGEMCGRACALKQ